MRLHSDRFKGLKAWIHPQCCLHSSGIKAIPGLKEFLDHSPALVSGNRHGKGGGIVVCLHPHTTSGLHILAEVFDSLLWSGLRLNTLSHSRREDKLNISSYFFFPQHYGAWLGRSSERADVLGDIRVGMVDIRGNGSWKPTHLLRYTYSTTTPLLSTEYTEW